ncbi:MAG TPA: ferric reductase-like transmembrane domain-containing protein [Acetobacteraceae bacterium]|jgi:sulfoxide reductase heme-binding subunit YedZ|nr:ferric reductase-like transmembrane domain-containing protein [Acetobacteraceae bacterium]
MMVPWRDRRGKFLPLKASVLAAVCVPGLLAAFWWADGDLGAKPVTEVIHDTGLWAIRFLLIALAVTPLRAALDWGKLLLLRRMLGLTALAYAVAHFSLYIVDQNGNLLVVASEIIHRFYLTIGFAVLLGLIALGTTSTDAAIRRMGRWWKRLHRLTYLLAVLALLHYFIQSKANVSEPVFVAGLYVWLMLWRLLPARWQRSIAVYPLLALVSGAAAAGIEFAWYGIATHINPWRVVAADETLRFGLRPAHYVVLVTLGLGVVILVRRIAPMVRLRLRPRLARTG